MIKFFILFLVIRMKENQNFNFKILKVLKKFTLVEKSSKWSNLDNPKLSKRETKLSKFWGQAILRTAKIMFTIHVKIRFKRLTDLKLSVLVNDLVNQIK